MRPRNLMRLPPAEEALMETIRGRLPGGYRISTTTHQRRVFFVAWCIDSFGHLHPLPTAAKQERYATAEEVLAACQLDWDERQGMDPSRLDQTRFLGPDGQKAVLHQGKQGLQVPWGVIYDRPGELGDVTRHHTLQSAFAALSERGYLPQVRHLRLSDAAVLGDDRAGYPGPAAL